MWNMSRGIINRVPISVEKPKGISLHSIPILISVPTIVSMCSVLYVKNGMSKASLSECRVLWLWFCHAAAQMSQKKSTRNEIRLIKFSCMVMELTWLLSLQGFLHLQWLCIQELIGLLQECKDHLQHYMQHWKHVPDTQNKSVVTISKHKKYKEHVWISFSINTYNVSFSTNSFSYKLNSTSTVQLF